MSEVNIKKISINKIDFYDISGLLDLDSRKLIIDVSCNKVKEIFGVKIAELVFNPYMISEKAKYIYILDDNGKYYSCLECIFSMNIKESISLSSVSINLILENILCNKIDDIKAKKLTFKTFYLGHPIHSVYIKGYSFNYSSTKKITIKTYTNKDFHIDIIVDSKNECSYNQLSKIIYNIIEMIMLIFGDIPITEMITLKNKETDLNLHFEMVDKYKPKLAKSFGKEILGCITSETINKQNLKEFEKFRKETKIIYDLFMININSDGYKEIKNCNLVQLMEGMYKTLINSKAELRDILIYFFGNYKSSKKILTRRDKRVVKDPNNSQIFIYKSNNHRNYLSHLNLNQNKNVFYKLENVYAYWKLCLAIRIFILEYIGIDYDKSAVPKYINEVDDWAKKNKLRFSSKINN